MRTFPFLALMMLAASPQTAGAQENVEFFEKRIRPVLVKHCYECHSAESDEIGGNLLLDTREGTLTGGDSGPAVVPEKAGESLLIEAIEYKSFEMPPDGMLPGEVIADFKRWIELGAPDPRKGKAEPTKNESASNGDEQEPLWSLAPIADADPPAVQDAAWPRTEIDRFILARLEQEGLQPAPDAEPITLLRRLTFDLTGLPPTIEQIERFQAEPSAETFGEIVDELLDSPRFGQRWGRHWLDTVRYAESAGSSRDVLMTTAWKYRDYVIDAYNDDLPYTQFITEQIAGDLLPADDADERARLQIATGLLAIGQKSLNGGNIPLDVAGDQIDVVGKAVLGLTISCARCHDHKFDPIPTRDYYSLAGIFLSTDTRYGGGIKRPKGDAALAQAYLPLGDPENVRERNKLTQQLAKLNKEKQSAAKKMESLAKKLPDDWREQKEALADLEATTKEDEEGIGKEQQQLLDRIAQYETARESVDQLDKDIAAAREKRKALPPLELAVGVQDANKVSDTRVRIRGERNKQGDNAPRGFLSCLAIDTEAALEKAGVGEIDDSQSGRRQLAAWLTAADNPLTPRVAVNRIWLHLFGRGIVETVDNFGHSGTEPSHPELLDFLANQFVQDGWSTKQLIRRIVLSRSYQMSSDFDPKAFELDPENRLVWRASRRRLEAEAIRDAMLAASGQLKTERPPFGSAVAQIGEGEVGRNLNTKPLEKPFPYRSVYLPIIRGIIPESLGLFDFPDPSNPASVRVASNVPAQSLYFMNSPLVIEQSRHAAGRVVEASGKPSERIAFAYKLILGRKPSAEEREQVAAFLNESTDGGEAANVEAWSLVCQALFATAEFRYLD